MVLLLTGLGLADGEKYCELDMNQIKRGIDFDWDRAPIVSTVHPYHALFH
jgi:hypothetical protein